MSPDTEAPVLQGESFSYLVEPVGGSIRLDCAVRGDPAPDIYWIKDGLPLRSGRLQHRLQNGSLIIRRTEARPGAGLGPPRTTSTLSGGPRWLFSRLASPGTVYKALSCPYPEILPLLTRATSSQ